MKELNINILRSPAKSLFRRILGAFYILIGVAWWIMRIVSQEPVTNRTTVTILDIVYTAFVGIAGVVFLIDGSGLSISRWFGEAYIKIDMARICIRKNVFSKEWVLFWKEIEQVEFSVIKIKFRLTDNSYRELNYDNLEYEHIQEIKKAINSISGEKNIKVIKPG
ncbi:MAG: hypothetical protein WCS03_06995 [Bacteroidota bacterium]